MRSTTLLGERRDGEVILFKLYSRRPFFFLEEGSQFQIVFVGDACLRVFEWQVMTRHSSCIFL